MSGIGLIIIGGLILWILYLIAKSNNEKLIEQKKINFNNGIFYEGTFKYGGGWAEVSETRDVTVKVKEKRVEITCIRNYKDGDMPPHMSIAYENIKNVSVKMQSEIQSNATLGKILLVGIFAFSKKKVDLSFLIIDYIDEFNSEQSFVFVNEGGFSNFAQELNKQRRKCLNNA